MIDVFTQDQTPELFQKIEAAVGRFIKTTAGDIEGRAKASMLEPKSGRMHGSHRASAPGESPANMTGAYMAGIRVLQEHSLEARVGTNVFYAPKLEYEMDRPLWGKTLAEIMPTLEANLERHIENL